MTLYMHYLGALFPGTGRLYIDRLFGGPTQFETHDASGFMRTGLLIGILASGSLLVIRNLTGTHFSPEFIIFLDVTHLGLVMVFLFVSLYCLIFKKHWTTER